MIRNGRVLGENLAVEVVVTERDPPLSKTWEGDRSHLVVFDYGSHHKASLRFLPWLSAGLRSMVNSALAADTVVAFSGLATS